MKATRPYDDAKPALYDSVREHSQTWCLLDLMIPTWMARRAQTDAMAVDRLIPVIVVRPFWAPVTRSTSFASRGSSYSL